LNPACSSTVRRFCIEYKFDSLPYSELPAELRKQLSNVIVAETVEIPDLGDTRARRATPEEVEAIFAETDRLPATLRSSQALGDPDPFWSVFYARFPRSAGYLVMSAPAFDADRRQAAVVAEQSYGSLGCPGHLYLHTRGDTGGWTIKAQWPTRVC
jgi:hypothetical protein